MDTTPSTDRLPSQESSSRLPMALALAVVAIVWVGGCVWSFEEQTSFATFKGFHLPWLLPLVIDGLAIAMAAVAFAAALDSRPAVFARLGIAFSVALSATSNASWAWERSKGDPGTIALAIVVPVLANLAFEVLLSESRRQVLRRRGQPAPVSLPYPRLARLLLSPFSTFLQWRRLVLDATDLGPQFAAAKAAATNATVATVASAPERATPAAPPALRPAPAPATEGATQPQQPSSALSAVDPQLAALVRNGKVGSTRNTEPRNGAKPQVSAAVAGSAADRSDATYMRIVQPLVAESIAATGAAPSQRSVRTAIEAKVQPAPGFKKVGELIRRATEAHRERSAQTATDDAERSDDPDREHINGRIPALSGATP